MTVAYHLKNTLDNAIIIGTLMKNADCFGIKCRPDYIFGQKKDEYSSVVLSGGGLPKPLEIETNGDIIWAVYDDGRITEQLRCLPSSILNLRHSAKAKKFFDCVKKVTQGLDIKDLDNPTPIED